ncbi:Lipocalin Can f 6.0101 [Galemys pyrenaicus]|uniref:Lipocalin Can f 6.0101 n=1 Tax=Galemys pyrenaicus TaxID=202257 RepID=A0A8J6DHI3_GALPY|nr:Lipocalin Can f 6.0101 [Galemys pyrenaicus]
MKLLLPLCLGLTLVCAWQPKSPVVRSNFDLSRITGNWYSVLLASDQKDKITENGSMRIFVKSMDVWENGTLYLVYHAKENGVCVEFPLICDKTENNGEFSLQYDGYNVFRVVETDYMNYLMFHLVNTNNGKTFQTMELYGKAPSYPHILMANTQKSVAVPTGRKPNVGPKLKAKFVEMCKKNGIVAENILDLTLSVFAQTPRTMEPKGLGDEGSRLGRATCQVTAAEREATEAPLLPGQEDSSGSPRNPPSKADSLRSGVHG